jgi:hypothetical protein
MDARPRSLLSAKVVGIASLVISAAALMVLIGISVETWATAARPSLCQRETSRAYAVALACADDKDADLGAKLEGNPAVGELLGAYAFVIVACIIGVLGYHAARLMQSEVLLLTATLDCLIFPLLLVLGIAVVAVGVDVRSTCAEYGVGAPDQASLPMCVHQWDRQLLELHAMKEILAEYGSGTCLRAIRDWDSRMALGAEHLYCSLQPTADSSPQHPREQCMCICKAEARRRCAIVPASALLSGFSFELMAIAALLAVSFGCTFCCSRASRSAIDAQGRLNAAREVQLKSSESQRHLDIQQSGMLL